MQSSDRRLKLIRSRAPSRDLGVENRGRSSDQRVIPRRTILLLQHDEDTLDIAARVVS